MKKLLLEKTLFFVISMGLVILVFLGGTYCFFINTYERLESNHNQKYVYTLIQTINNQLLHLRQSNLNYANQTNTESFFANDIKLKNIELDFILKIDSNQNIIFRKSHESIKERLFTELINTHNKSHSITAIFPFKDKVVMFSKEKITTSNQNGYLIIGRLLTGKMIKERVSFFEEINLIKGPLTQVKITKKYDSVYFSKIAKNSFIQDSLFINQIAFSNKDGLLLFALETKNKRDIVATGEKTIILLILVVIFFVILIFFITHKYMKAIKMNNEVLEKEVDKRTQQIQSALDELEKVNLKLYDIAHTDFLTKTRNRRNFFIHSENAYNKSEREEKELSVIMIDIDNFKPFNDNHGHAVGDQVLVLFSECVKKQLDEQDIFGRLGGEEFAITLYDTSLDVAMEKAERIRKAIEKIELDTENSRLTITASFGISDKRQCKNLDQMLQKADKLLYSAKHSGKNKVRSRLNNP